MIPVVALPQANSYIANTPRALSSAAESTTPTKLKDLIVEGRSEAEIRFRASRLRLFLKHNGMGGVMASGGAVARALRNQASELIVEKRGGCAQRSWRRQLLQRTGRQGKVAARRLSMASNAHPLHELFTPFPRLRCNYALLPVTLQYDSWSPLPPLDDVALAALAKGQPPPAMQPLPRDALVDFVNMRAKAPSDWQLDLPASRFILDGCFTVMVGDHVTVCNLQSEQGEKWNGQQGVIASWDDKKDRWKVDVNSGGNINVKPQNVQLTGTVPTDERGRSCAHEHTGESCCTAKLPSFLPPSASSVMAVECTDDETDVGGATNGKPVQQQAF